MAACGSGATPSCWSKPRFRPGATPRRLCASDAECGRSCHADRTAIWWDSYEHAALGTGPEVSDCDPVTLCDLLLQLELHIGKRAEVASDDLLPVAQPGDRLRHADEVDCVIRSQYLVGSIGVAARR